MAAEVKLVDPEQGEFLAEPERKSEKENHFFRIIANRPEVVKNFVPRYGANYGLRLG